MPAPKGNDNASKFSMDVVHEICTLIAEGANVKDACKEAGISYDAFRDWRYNDDVVSNLYVKAVQDKADSKDSEIDRVLDMLEKGEIDASTANVMIQTQKWRMSKYYPKMFGQNSSIDVTSDGEKITGSPIIIDNAQGEEPREL